MGGYGGMDNSIGNLRALRFFVVDAT